VDKRGIARQQHVQVAQWQTSHKIQTLAMLMQAVF